jgi:hypothetical protein
MQLSEVPSWYDSTLDHMREEVYIGAITAHPYLANAVQVSVPIENAIALSDGQTEPEFTRPDNIDNPADFLHNEVCDVERPSMTSMTQKTGDVLSDGRTPSATLGILKALAAKARVSESARKSLAGHLMEMIAKKEAHLKIAKKVATRLSKDGLSGEEFDKLNSYLQEDVLRDLMYNGTIASMIADRRQELLSQLSRGESDVGADKRKRRDSNGNWVRWDPKAQKWVKAKVETRYDKNTGKALIWDEHTQKWVPQANRS